MVGELNTVLFKEHFTIRVSHKQELTEGKRLSPKMLEDRVSDFLRNKFGQKFYERSLQIEPNKYHNFDLVSESKNFYGS